MKLVLNSFFLSLLFFYVPVFAEDYHKEFTLKVSGIKIGKLNWTIKIDGDEYF